jgi:hypothetical protein
MMRGAARGPRLACLVLLAALPAAPALAQTSVNPGALDQLAPPSPPPSHTHPPHRMRPARHTAPAHRPAQNGKAAAPEHPAPPAKPPAPKRPTQAGSITVPPAPPPPPVLPPPLVVPTRPVAPRPPAPVIEGAPGSVTPTKTGLRVTFGSALAEISPATQASVQALAQADKQAANFYTITAYATGSPDDPSTARRLALSRGLSLRTVLMTAGVPSAHIFVRAMGAGGLDFAQGPPDRADLVVTPGDLPPPAVGAPPGGGATAAATPAAKAAP